MGRMCEIDNPGWCDSPGRPVPGDLSGAESAPGQQEPLPPAAGSEGAAGCTSSLLLDPCLEALLTQGPAGEQ